MANLTAVRQNTVADPYRFVAAQADKGHVGPIDRCLPLYDAARLLGTNRPHVYRVLKREESTRN